MAGQRIVLVGGIVDGLIATLSPMDPFGPVLVGRGETAGPMLLALGVRPWKRIELLMPVDLCEAAGACEAVLRERYPTISIHVHPIACASHSTVGAWISALRAWRAGQGGVLAQPDHWVVLVPAGLVHWHAAWLLAAESGEFPAALLEVTPSSGAGLAPEYIWYRPPSREGGAWTLRERASATYRSQPVFSADGPTERRVLEALRELGLCGGHPAWRRTVETAAALAPHGVPVLIQGETGTGKGMLARFIHRVGPRPDGPFVSVNCGALPAALIGSVLFGHRKGAFTGAERDQAGKFEIADGGTLFLDEIGEMPLELQPQLLKVLEDGVVEPIGARGGRRVDVRILAATNRDLSEAVAERRFREDLYYRLSFGLVDVPALRERIDDLPMLAAHVLKQINGSLRSPRRITPEGLAWLRAQRWEGNVRDLQNTIGRTALLSREAELGPEAFAAALRSPRAGTGASWPTPHEGFRMEDFLGEARCRFFDEALRIANGSQSAAARLLGVSPQAVHRYVREHQGKV